MSTAADLIKSSLRVIQAISSGETPTAAEQADGLEALNDILEEWSNDGFMLFEETSEEFVLIPGTGLYTIGTGAMFNTSRPQFITRANLKVPGPAGQNSEVPLKILNFDEWSKITLKTLQSSLPQYLYYNSSVPNGELNFWAVPNTANSVVLYSQKPLGAVVAATTLAYPLGYKKALKYTLADELQPEYGKAYNPKIQDIAINAKTSCQRNNTEPVYLQSDAFGLNECRPYDIRIGR